MVSLSPNLHNGILKGTLYKSNFGKPVLNNFKNLFDKISYVLYYFIIILRQIYIHEFNF